MSIPSMHLNSNPPPLQNKPYSPSPSQSLPSTASTLTSAENPSSIESWSCFAWICSLFSINQQEETSSEQTPLIPSNVGLPIKPIVPSPGSESTLRSGCYTSLKDLINPPPDGMEPVKIVDGYYVSLLFQTKIGLVGDPPEHTEINGSLYLRLDQLEVFIKKTQLEEFS